MAEQIGKIEKPVAEEFKASRKVYLLPLIFAGEDAPTEYAEKFHLYWEQAKAHIRNLEIKIGPVNRIYHESIALGGEEGLKLVEKLNPHSYQIAQDKCQSGAELETTEDKELADEVFDWERCFLLGFASEKVATKVMEFYLEASTKRYQYIAEKIDKTLKSGEAGLLFIREEHRVQFPKDIEVFSIAPPALDEIHRWFRDRELKGTTEGK
jgi:hypothetical protein